MAMSRDRIQFEIPLRRLDDIKYRMLLKDCFGLKEHEIPDGGRYLPSDQVFKIICRPSQFGRFIVARNSRGIQNLISELNARTIPHKAIRTPVEVWDRKNTFYDA